MQICTKCVEIIKQCDYPETGEEFYCNCQNTLQAEFDKNLWKFTDKTTLQYDCYLLSRAAKQFIMSIANLFKRKVT